MGLFSRRSRSRAAHGGVRRSTTAKHFADFIETRAGVEAYFEVETPREPAALLLVARTGEWTRRRVPDLAAGAQLARELGVPFYEINRTGYPESVRRWNAEHRRA